MNHECIKDLSMKISIEFKDQASPFPFERIFRKLKFDPSSGGGGGGALLLKSKRIFSLHSPCNRRTIVDIESAQHLPYQSM